MANPLSILSWPIVFILFYSYFIPISVYLNGNFNYYWDVFKSTVTEDESSTVYDFIVGKINLINSVNLFNHKNDYKINL